MGPEGLPLVKPPYGTVTAIDMNSGEHVWTKANGDALNRHPLLRELDLPPLGTPSRPSALVTRTLLFLGEGSDAFGGVSFGGKAFQAFDKASGEILWSMELSGGTTSQPMTYMHEGRQYVVVPIGDSGHPAEWVALGLP
jgi:glucose dehydrogenase